MKLRELQRRVGGLNLPSLPAVVESVQRACEDPTAGLRDVAAVIAQDPPLVARILRVVNSAYIGLKVPVVSIEHSVAVLGLDALQNLVLQVAAIDLFDHLREREDYDVRGMWKHSILCGRLTRLVPARLRRGVPDDALELAGILHDIGRFVLLDLARDEYVELAARAEREGRPLEELEHEELGFDHAQVGAVLARRWKLPDLVGRCIALHHVAGDVERLQEPGVAPLVVADRLARAVERDPTRLPEEAEDFLPPRLARALRLSSDEVCGLAEIAAYALERISF